MGTFGTFTVTTAGIPYAGADRDWSTAHGRDLRGQRKRVRHALGHSSPGTRDAYVVTFSATNGVDPNQSFTLKVIGAVFGVNPNSGPATGGTTVTITGTGFTRATAVDFGATAATDVTVVNDSTITATSPPGTGVVNVTVTTSGGVSPIGPADQFTYIVAPPPTVVSLVRYGFHAQPTSLVLTFSSAARRWPRM